MSLYGNNEYKLSIEYPSDWQVIENYRGTIAAIISPKEGKKDDFREKVVLNVLDNKGSPLPPKEFNVMMLQSIQKEIEHLNIITPATPVETGGYPTFYMVYEGVQLDRTLKWFRMWYIVDTLVYTLSYTASPKSFDKYWKIVNTMMESFKVYE